MKSQKDKPKGNGVENFVELHKMKLEVKKHKLQEVSFMKDCLIELKLPVLSIINLLTYISFLTNSLMLSVPITSLF